MQKSFFKSRQDVPFVVLGHICDMIKGNESDVGNVVFEILAKVVFKFLCFILFNSLGFASK